jgi:hypothetical protein
VRRLHDRRLSAGDGTIAISKTSMVQYKIKDMPTIDALVVGGVAYLGGMNDPLCNLGDSGTGDGIVELSVQSEVPSSVADTMWFSGARGLQYSVHKHRPDKVAPNGVEVLDAIDCILHNRPFSPICRRLTDYSFMVRQSLCSSFITHSSRYDVLVDAGTGRGQSLQYILSDDLRLHRDGRPFTLILCDPVIDCAKINDIVKCCEARTISSMRIVDCTVDDLCRVCNLPGYIVIAQCKLANVMNALRKIEGAIARTCVLCTFSLQHVLSDVMDHVTAVDFIGCGYVYDGMVDEDITISYGGITMQVVNGVGITTWEGDTFREHPLQLHDMVRGKSFMSTDVVHGFITSNDSMITSRLYISSTLPV